MKLHLKKYLSEFIGKIKTLYKIVFTTPKEAGKFYKLLKALFIMQTELPHYYNYTTNIDTEGNLDIYLDNNKIEYERLPEFIYEQYARSIKLKQETQEDIEGLEIRLSKLKKEATILESDYIAKEKQISTYLECKKSFLHVDVNPYADKKLG